MTPVLWDAVQHLIHKVFYHNMASILIIDDKKAIRKTLSEILSYEGYKIEEAAEAIKPEKTTGFHPCRQFPDRFYARDENKF